MCIKRAIGTTKRPFLRQLAVAGRDIGFHPVIRRPTGWKPMPLISRSIRAPFAKAMRGFFVEFEEAMGVVEERKSFRPS